MPSTQLIAIETALLVSTIALNAYLFGKVHAIALQVYSGVADGMRLSRTTRQLTLINVWGSYIFLLIATNALVAIALLQIGETATSREAANIANLFAMPLFLTVPFLLLSGGMTVLSLTKMIRRGVRGEPA